jgi:hypothetical protein
MAESADAHGASSKSSAGEISIPWVVLASVLGGVGVGLISYWILTQNWLYFSGVVLVIVSCLMFLSPRMGPDHA